MHAFTRSRSVVAVVAVVLAGIFVAWLMVGAGGDPERTAAPSTTTGTTTDTTTDATTDAATDTASSSDAPEAGGGDAERSGRGERTGSKDAGNGASTSGGSGAAASGSAEPGSTGGPAGSGDEGSGGTSRDDDATAGNDSDGQEPGTATGATVPVEPVQTLAPVPLESVGDFRTGLTVRLASMEAVEAEARAPGEISGPALRVTVEADNDAHGAVSLDGVVVFLSYGDDRTPASQFGSSSDPLLGDLAPGASRTGTYVFTVPPDQRDDVRVEISYTGSAPTVAFTGSVDG